MDLEPLAKTDDVLGAVWLATVALSYAEAARNADVVEQDVLFSQSDIQALARRFCTKQVQNARVSQWSNADHPQSSRPYLRARGPLRRIALPGEAGGRDEMPARLFALETPVLRLAGTTVTFGALLDWVGGPWSRRIQRRPVDPALLKDRAPIISNSSLEERPWYWEGNVQHALVEHLTSRGYEVIQAIDTASKAAGKDVIAKTPEGRTLWVSVKGYPQSTAKTNGATQARHWFSHALFDMALYRDQPDADLLAISLPQGFGTYERLAQRVTWLRRNLPFDIYWINEDGRVDLEVSVEGTMR